MRLARQQILASTIAILAAGCSSGAATPTPPPSASTPTPTPTPAPTPTPTPTPAATLAAVTTADLGKGWNLGNTLEAVNSTANRPLTTSQETLYGNPVVNQQIFNGVAAAGFKSVRIPVAWVQYLDQNNNIQPFWLNRVKEVVDMALNAGLYVFINNHDSLDFPPLILEEATGDARLQKLWTQVANTFKNYDNRLMFAGTNEIHDGYGVPTAENCRIQTEFNQIFVDAVRATGGNNASRTLIFQGYNTDIDNTIGACGAKVPTDTISGRLIMEFHFYAPYDFTLNDKSAIWQWGSIAVDPAVTQTWANEAYVEAQFDKAKAAYSDKGIPVIIGEYCAMSKTEYDPSRKYRDYWTKYVTGSAVRHGFSPQYWDIGYHLNHECGVLRRETGLPSYQTTLDAIFAAP